MDDALKDTRKLVFEGRLSTSVELFGRNWELQILTAAEETEVELSPTMRAFTEEERSNALSAAAAERQRLTVTRAIRKIDGRDVLRDEVARAVSDMSASQILLLALEYNKLLVRERKALNFDSLKNSSTTPSQSSAGK